MDDTNDPQGWMIEAVRLLDTSDASLFWQVQMSAPQALIATEGLMEMNEATRANLVAFIEGARRIVGKQLDRRRAGYVGVTLGREYSRVVYIQAYLGSEEAAKAEVVAALKKLAGECQADEAWDTEKVDTVLKFRAWWD